MTDRRIAGTISGVVLALALTTSGCRAGGWVAGVFSDLAGTSGDVACDRRYVSDTGEPAAFCQEIIDTVAVSQVGDDCRDRHQALALEGRCPREKIIGGCRVSVTNDDGSEVYDWYYDVGELEHEKGQSFESRVTSVEDVKATCADRSRYEDGAEFVAP